LICVSHQGIGIAQSMWDIVSGLGLKEGLQEFQEQFGKDAKATIANTQLAKDHGIDVHRLDEIQQNLHQQGQELHERTIGAAVDMLAKDDTIKQLLEIKTAPREDDAAWPDSEPETQLAEASSAQVRSAGAASPASSSTAAPIPTNEVSASACDAPATSSTSVPVRTPPRLASAEPLPHSADNADPSADVRNERSTGPPERGRTEPRTRQLEAEVRRLTAVRAAAESQLSAATGRAAELEARWAELSAVSDDALRQADEARQQVTMLRQAVEEKDARIAAAEDAREELASERCRAAQQLQDLEASFQERLLREVSQKEQELLDEVAYLRKASETKERRIRELGEEKAFLEKRLARGKEGTEQTVGREAMLEAHTAIAKAFGDASADHPCIRLLDEPLLKFTAALFRQALFRRVFYAASALMWVFALRHAIVPSTDHSIHT
jgi:hypothetical protein